MTLKQILCLIAFLLGVGQLNLEAQEGKNGRDRKIMLPGETHCFSTLEAKVKLAPKQDVVYYWYKNNALHHSQGDYEGNLIDGVYVIYYATNDLKEKGRYKKGCKDGEWKSWYENGRIKEIYNWNRGILSGRYCFFDSLGQVSYTGCYRNNLLHGTFTHYFNGLITVRQVYKNGKTVTAKEKKQKVVADSTTVATEPLVKEVKAKKVKTTKHKVKATKVEKTNATSFLKRVGKRIKGWFGKKQGKPTHELEEKVVKPISTTR